MKNSKKIKHVNKILSPHEAIVLGDFAKNYTFVFHDEKQSYHGSKKQSSLHLIVI